MKKLKLVIFVVLFLQCLQTALGSDAQMLWLPVHKEVFPLLMADPRSAQFSLTVFGYAGKTLTSGSIGHQIELWRLEMQDGSMLQVGLEASAHTRLSLSKTGQNAALQSTDWFFGFPIEYRRETWALRLWSYHTSSHLGDNYLIQQGLTPISYSREAVEILGAYFLGPITLYAGGSQTIHVIPDINGSALHGGFQVWSKPFDVKKTMQFFGAADFQPKGQIGWDITTTLEAGIGITPEKSDKRMRIYVNYFTGPSPEGQFYNQDRTSWAGGLAFDF